MSSIRRTSAPRLRLGRLPLRWRVTLSAVLALAVILAALGAFLVLRQSGDLVAGIDSSLDARAAQLISAVGAGDGNFTDAGDAVVPGLPRREDLAQVLAADGRVLQSAGGDEGDRGLLDAAQLRRAGTRAIRVTVDLPEQGEVRLLAVPSGGGRVVVVGSSLAQVDAARRSLLLLLIAGGLGALALGGLGAWWLSGRALRPLDRLRAAAEAIGADDLHERVPVPPTGDEAARLAVTLNALLARVSRAVDDQRDFLADASHELRSPVAVLRAELEVALRAPDTPESQRETFESLREEADRLSRLTDDLLILARAEAGQLELAREATGLEQAAARGRRLLAAAADRKGVRLSARLQEAPVWGDPDRLTQVALNLLDNAVRHAPAGSEVTAETAARADSAFLAVTDGGPGVPDELVPSLFERFSRGDAARTRDGGGTGLGLAIARAIARSHGGTLRLDRTGADGSRFVVEIPRRRHATDPNG